MTSIFLALSADVEPSPLDAAVWHEHRVPQPSVRRVAGVSVDSVMLHCYAFPADVGNPSKVLRHGHVVHDGIRSATLYVPPGVGPTDEQLAFVARAAGLKPQDLPQYEPIAVNRYPKPEDVPLSVCAWAGDITAACSGNYESECGHQSVYLSATEPFPRCDECGRSCRWRLT